MFAKKATVMGPVSQSAGQVTNLQSAPIIETYADTMLWREAVMDWSVNVQSCADRGDTKAAKQKEQSHAWN